MWMQLKDADSGMRRKLVAASCALLGSAPAARAQIHDVVDTVNRALEDWQLDAAFAYYHEDGRIQALEPVISAEHTFASGSQIGLDFTFDSLSGSTPNGALTSRQPQTFASPSAKSFAQARHIYSVSGGRLPVDPNYSDARVSGGGSWTLPLTRLMRATLGGKFSYEDDFYSATVSAALERDFNQKNTTVSLGVNSENDFLQPIGGAPAPLSDYTLFEKGGHESKHGLGLLAGVTQVVSRNWITLANVSVDRFSGYLNDPYKIVSVVNAAGDPISYLYENRPDTRTRRSVYLENRAGWSRGSVTAGLRYMTDTWGIHSDTAQLRLRWWAANRDQYLEPGVRWYRQNAANFFHPWLEQGSTATADASADFRLDAFHALTYGLKYGHRLGNGSGSFGRPDSELNIRLEYYEQTFHSPGAEPPTLSGLDVYPQLKALLLQVGMTY
jgi:hypothetical protein